MRELKRRGLAAALICSESFLELGRTQARVFGVPDLPLVVVPHPLGGLALDRVEERARAAVPQVIEIIKEHAQ
ncbi:MAG: hypothetical protein HY323_09460 [Betaproteobacteria bacterium]|nr:hypothetical protein [Betaproteobacteria bacterium]MBI3937192.1 hypothetical protein [Betaproteobacteria bacterium]